MGGPPGWLPWPAHLSPGGSAPSAEPSLNDFMPALPIIKSPGMMASCSGAEKQASARMIIHQQKAGRFRLEASARKALKQLLAKAAPKPLHSGKIGAGEDDIGLCSARELLEHLEAKHGRAAAKACGALWGTFRSPMGGAAPEEYFTRQAELQKKLKNTDAPARDAGIKKIGRAHV